MDEPELAKHWADVDRAVEELARRMPETRPAIVDRARATVRLGSGEVIAVGSLVDRPAHHRPNDILERLLEARRAAEEVALLPIGSWQEMAPRLGLALRPNHQRLVGHIIEPNLLLAVVADAGRSLVPVTQDLLRRWGRSERCVVEVAIGNSADQRIECRDVPAALAPWRSDHVVIKAITGGPFTTGTMIDGDSLDRALAPSERSGALLVLALGDRAMLVAWWPSKRAPEGINEAARLLWGLAATFDRRTSTSAPSGQRAIVHCRSDGQLVRFGPRDDAA